MIRRILLFIDTIFLCLAIIVAIDYVNYITDVKYVDNMKTVILDNVVNLNMEGKNLVLENLEYNKEYSYNFKVENLSDQKTDFNILFNNIANDFSNELVYELYEKDKLSVSETVAPKSGRSSYMKLGIGLKPAETKEYTLKFKLINRQNTETANYEGKKFIATLEINSVYIKSNINTATNYILANNTTTDIEGLVETNDTDTGEKVYYYRGNVSNNYVKFNDQLWRIIRINEDGSIRIIKDDNLQYNVQYNVDSKADGANEYANSNISNELDKYYNETLKKYDSMIKEENYCTKLSVVRNDTMKTADTDRNYLEYTPSFKCMNQEKRKVGLISYNEVVLSGMNYMSNDTSYLNNGDNKSTWVASKAGVVNYNNEKYVWYINSSLKDTDVADTDISIRPVVNIKPTLNATDKGTIDNPYIFSE